MSELLRSTLVTAKSLLYSRASYSNKNGQASVPEAAALICTCQRPLVLQPSYVQNVQNATHGKGAVPKSSLMVNAPYSRGLAWRAQIELLLSCMSMQEPVLC